MDLAPYSDERTPEFEAIVERIRRRLNLTTLKYQRLSDLVAAIGLPKDRLCTYCWTGRRLRARFCLLLEGEKSTDEPARIGLLFMGKGDWLGS